MHTHADDFSKAVDRIRLEAAQRLCPEAKARLGQYFTPFRLAQFMASLPEFAPEHIRVLDPGAGVGSLLAACVSRVCVGATRPRRISVTAHEVDPGLLPYLNRTLDLCARECRQVGVEFTQEVRYGDFIRSAVEHLDRGLFGGQGDALYDYVILNPPYLKIHSASETRGLLRRLRIETSNLYTAFVATAYRLLADRGDMVAITPRSFCNGAYFRPFREDFLHHMSLRRLHLFESREDAFRDDAVLQENVVFHAVRTSRMPTEITISTSTGPGDPVLTLHTLPYARVVRPGDPQQFIHITPNVTATRVADQFARLTRTLDHLGIAVSTGRVVDFRAEQYLRWNAEPGTAPLLYPSHLSSGTITWPRVGGRKPNAITISEGSQALLVPNGYYVLVKRFTSKEERRRVVAVVHNPAAFQAEWVGFENHLNYYHARGACLRPALAHGLAAYLNSTLVDQYFRQFSGHTQVNATDLRSLKYPEVSVLERIGARLERIGASQADVDSTVEQEVFGAG